MKSCKLAIPLLADKPRGFENHPLALAWHAWVRAPTFDAVINCHNWPIKCLAFSGAGMNFRGPVCETKIFFFCILERVDGVHGEISMNPNDPSPPPSPSFTFWLSFHFSRGQYRKSPSLGISLPRNQTETLATQASLSPAPARFSHFFLLNDFSPLSRSLERANSHTGKLHFPVTFDIWCCQRVALAWRPLLWSTSNTTLSLEPLTLQNDHTNRGHPDKILRKILKLTNHK